MKEKRKIADALILSLFVHLICLLLSFYVLIPTLHEAMRGAEESIPILFPKTVDAVSRTIVKRKPAMFATNSPEKLRSDLGGPARGFVALSTRTQEENILPAGTYSGEDWGAGQDMGVGTGDGKGGPRAERLAYSRGTSGFGAGHTEKAAVLPAIAHPEHTQTDTSMVLKKSAEDAYQNMPAISSSLKVDVVFIISCRDTMQEYLEYAIDLMERKIKYYKQAKEDYRVGILKSRTGGYLHEHEIEYRPLTSDLNEALATVGEMRELEGYGNDVLLNTIRYALDRYSFRPDALRNIIVIGNDVPFCGGYSPRTVIDLCRKKRITLEIHGADERVGPVMARETGGKWYPLENMLDTASLETYRDTQGRSAPGRGASPGHWKLRYTLDSVVEGRLTRRGERE